MWQRFWVRGAARDAASLGDKVFSRPLRTGHFTFEALKRLQTGAMCAIVRGGSHAVVLSASLFRIVISQSAAVLLSFYLVYFVVQVGMSEETAIDDIQKERAWMRAWVWLWSFLEKWTRVRFRSARESGEAGAGEGESSRGFRVAGSPLASPGMTLVGKKPLR